MAYCFVSPGDRDVDAGLKKKISFAWLERSLQLPIKKPGNSSQQSVVHEHFKLGDFFKKVSIFGKALCTVCNKLTNYASRGYKSLEAHCETSIHKEKLCIRKNNYSLTSFATETSVKVEPNTKIEPAVVPMCNRISNSEKVPVSFEAMVLGVIAEHSLPMSMAPVLVKLSKSLATDKPALNMLSMDRTTASYKMTHGLGKSFLDKTVTAMKECPFSLNIDESTSKGLKRILAVLVSYYGVEDERVLVEHFASLELVKVDSESLYNALIDVFKKHDIPWENCVSILMDSCNVMRGSKTGLETRIRQNLANHLLDIDGDSCHHIHNASKKFSSPFGNYLESLFTDVYNDIKWSADLKDWLEQMCELVGVKFTMPERFLSHRWLSAYDAALDTQRLFNVLQMFYFGFMEKSVKPDYLEIMVQLYRGMHLGKEVRQKMGDIRSKLSSKKLTDDGKKRKQRIVEKLFFTDKKTKLQLGFYTSVLPLLKNYVCLFQGRDTLVHRLHDKQIETFTEFLGYFVKPEHIAGKTAKKLKTLDLTDDDGKFMDIADMYVGCTAEKIIKGSRKDDSDVEKFRKQASAAYIGCAKHLQYKMPLDSPLLQAISCVDPTIRNLSEAGKGMKVLASKLHHFLDEEEQSTVLKEIVRFQVDNLPAYEGDEEFVKWWVQIFKNPRYACLSKIIRVIMSIFHGPQVESSFNLMGDIVDIRSTRMNPETLSAVQTVKYAFRARKTTSLEYFRRDDPKYGPVHTKICASLRTAASRYKKEQERRRFENEQRKASLKLPTTKIQSKESAKAEMKAKIAKNLKKQSQKRALEVLAEKARKKQKC